MNNTITVKEINSKLTKKTKRNENEKNERCRTGAHKLCGQHGASAQQMRQGHGGAAQDMRERCVTSAFSMRRHRVGRAIIVRHIIKKKLKKKPLFHCSPGKEVVGGRDRQEVMQSERWMMMVEDAV